MRCELVVALAVLAACGRGNGAPAVDGVEPAQVSTLIDTVVTVRGHDFFLDARADLGAGAAEVTGSIAVAIDGVAIASVTRRDGRTLEIVIPAGTPVGVYDVVVTAAGGAEACATDALTVIAEPIGLPLSIEDAPGGAGVAIDARTLVAGDTLALHAVVRHGGAFVADVAATWIVDGAVGTLDDDGPATRSVLDARRAGSGAVRAHHATAGDAATGALTVVAAAPTAIAIVDGSGAEIAALAITTDDVVALHAERRDDFGNVVGPSSATWSVTGAIGTVGAGVAADAALDLTRPGTGTVTAIDAAIGTDATGTITVTAGHAATLAIAPSTVTRSADDPPLGFTATAADADGNPTADLGALTWSIASGPITALAPTGVLDAITAGTGTIAVASSHGASATSGAITIVPGDAVALTIAPATHTCAAGDAAVDFAASGVDGDGNATADLGTLAWTHSGPIRALDGATGRFTPVHAGVGRIAVTSSLGPTATSGDVTVLGAAQLVAVLTTRGRASLGETFVATMTVTNPGVADALAVVPSSLAVTGGITLVSGPTPAMADVAVGASVAFVWTYQAVTAGPAGLAGTASGVDAAWGTAIASAPTSTAVTIDDQISLIAADPFGDATAFSSVFGYRGLVYLGPNRSGTGMVRFATDGSGGESVGLAFARDTNNNTSSNTSSAPYPAIGATGCTPNTASCGPDNEDGRGLFAAGAFGATEWLVAGGARSTGNLDYVYLSSSSGPSLAFAYADIGTFLGGQTKGFSAMHVFGSRIYLGFPDTGGNRPYLLALLATPTLPGLEVDTAQEAINLGADSMPGMASSATAMIDAITDFNGRVYFANAGACWRSITTTPPSAYDAQPGDWLPCTPSASAYTALTSRPTTKTADLEPADRAIPQLATFGGRLFMGRNTTVGPQLWGCTPATTGNGLGCDPGDWSLVAANTVGNTRLTQLGDAGNTTIALVVATSTHLYVGFDNAATGLRIHRTALAAATAASFTGPIGGAGFGDPTRSRILSASQIADAVYLVTGDGVTAASVWRVLD